MIHMRFKSQHNNKLRGNLSPGDHHYKAFVGPPETYDLISAMQFNLLTLLGLREHHYLLDIGCGSLRAGRLFIPYLLPGHYFGIEPEQWLIEEGKKNELGRDIIALKNPVFSDDDNFTLTTFGRDFDFLLAQSIFSHTSQTQIERCFSQAKKCMKSTSVFVATFVKGEKNYTGNKWVYPGCATYTLEHMTGLAEKYGLVCKSINWPHPALQTWILIFNPENEKRILDISDISRIPALEKERDFYKERVVILEKHPYVKLGLKVNRFIKRIFRK